MIIQNRNRGFIALTLVIIISGILLVLISYSSLESANFFDQTMRKEYRIMNHYYAKYCLNQAILILAHDYFFEINNNDEIIDFSDYHCQIIKVNRVGNIRKITTVGNYMKANVYMNAEVRISDTSVEIIDVK